MHGIRSGCDHWPCRHRPEIEMKQVFSKNGFTRVKIIDGGKTYCIVFITIQMGQRKR